MIGNSFCKGTVYERACVRVERMEDTLAYGVERTVAED